MSVWINVAGLSFGWWACILGAANGRAWIGPLVVGIHLLFYTAASLDRRRALVYLIDTIFLGFLLDSLLGAMGVVTFSSPFVIGWLSPLWMVALWPNFATSLTSSMNFLKGRPAAAAFVGAIGGPIAYLGGSELGAVAFADSTGLGWVALAWGVALPILTVLAPDREPLAELASTTEVRA